MTRTKTKGQVATSTPATNETVRTIADLARRLDVDRGTIRNWTDKGMPREPDGSFALGDVEAWLAERDDGTDEGLTYWRIRKERSAALRGEAELARQRGELISRTEHDAAISSLIESFVSGLENLPPKVTPLLVGARGYQEILNLLVDHIRSLRVQLAAKHAPRPATEDSAGSRIPTRESRPSGSRSNAEVEAE